MVNADQTGSARVCQSGLIVNPPRSLTRSPTAFAFDSPRIPPFADGMGLIINGESIDDEIIDGEFRNIKSHYERLLQVSCCERDPEFRGRAKQQITGRVLLAQQAEKLIPEVAADEIDKAFAELVEEHGGEDRFYLNMGVPSKDEAMVKRNIGNSLRVHKLLEQEVYANCAEPAEHDLRAFYDQHQDHFKSAEEVRAMHISKSLRGANSREEVYRVLRDVRQQLLDGADFETLASQHNDRQGQEIDLGFFKRGEFMEDFEVIAFSMDKGEVSPVFVTQLGFHLCKVTDRRDSVLQPFEEVRDQVRELWLGHERQRLLDAYLEKLKEQAKVEDSDPEEELAEEREAVASFLANANNNQGTEARPPEPVAHRH